MVRKIASLCLAAVTACGMLAPALAAFAPGDVVAQTQVGECLTFGAMQEALLEGRALLEMSLLPAALPWLSGTPRGDGHPVLLVPGFMASDAALFVLKAYLQRKGYEVHTWGLGRNLGFRSKLATALPQKIRYLHHVTGRKVSLVGWSLGGVFRSTAPSMHRIVCATSSPWAVPSRWTTQATSRRPWCGPCTG